jgi:hypothetical protein
MSWSSVADGVTDNQAASRRRNNLHPAAVTGQAEAGFLLVGTPPRETWQALQLMLEHAGAITAPDEVRLWLGAGTIIAGGRAPH